MSSRKTANVAIVRPFQADGNAEVGLASPSHRTARIATVALGILFLLVISSAGQGQTAAPAEDPFPIKRVFVPEKRVGEAMEQARQGLFVQMPREKFEEKVRNAAAQQSSKNQPRLVKATYTATLKN